MLPQRILLVDDDPDILSSVGELIQLKARLQVLTASNGREALAVVSRERPDAIVTDYRMPEMDGLELTRAVKRREPSVPIVMVTAYGEATLTQEAKAAGVCEVIPKPFDMDVLLEALDECYEAVHG